MEINQQRTIENIEEREDYQGTVKPFFINTSAVKLVPINIKSIINPDTLRLLEEFVEVPSNEYIENT